MTYNSRSAMKSKISFNWRVPDTRAMLCTDNTKHACKCTLYTNLMNTHVVLADQILRRPHLSNDSHNSSSRKLPILCNLTLEFSEFVEINTHPESRICKYTQVEVLE